MAYNFSPQDERVMRLADYEDLLEGPSEPANPLVHELNELRAELAAAKELLALKEAEVEGFAKEANETIEEVARVAMAEIGKHQAAARKIQRHNFKVDFLSSFVTGITSTLGAGVGLGGRRQLYKR